MLATIFILSLNDLLLCISGWPCIALCTTEFNWLHFDTTVAALRPLSNLLMPSYSFLSTILGATLLILHPINCLKFYMNILKCTLQITHPHVQTRKRPSGECCCSPRKNTFQGFELNLQMHDASLVF